MHYLCIRECLNLRFDGKLFIFLQCLQLHGGWGYMMETPIARSYADARVQTIYGGANEIMKELISRNVIKPAN